MKINPWIHYRFESKIDDGILYVFDSNTCKIVKSNEVAYDILKLIDEGIGYKELIIRILEKWEFENESVIIKFLESIQEMGWITGFELISSNNGDI